MQPVIPTPPTVPQVSLTVETEAFSGVNQIRRSLGRAVALMIGSRIVDQAVIMAPGDTLTISDGTSGFLAIANGTLAVTVNTSLALTMSTILAMDMTTTALVFHNASTTDTVSLHLSYLVPLPG